MPAARWQLSAHWKDIDIKKRNHNEKSCERNCVHISGICHRVSNAGCAILAVGNVIVRPLKAVSWETTLAKLRAPQVACRRLHDEVLVESSVRLNTWWLAWLLCSGEWAAAIADANAPDPVVRVLISPPGRRDG